MIGLEGFDLLLVAEPTTGSYFTVCGADVVVVIVAGHFISGIQQLGYANVLSFSIVHPCSFCSGLSSRNTVPHLKHKRITIIQDAQLFHRIILCHVLKCDYFEIDLPRAARFGIATNTLLTPVYYLNCGAWFNIFTFYS